MNNRQVSVLLLAALVAVVSSSSTASAKTGEELFQTICFACHTVGGGKKVGPDLAGVAERRTGEWLFSFVKSSQTMIKAGDEDAVALFNEYNQLVMPDPAFTDAEIQLVVDYLSEGGAGAEPSAPAEPMRDATPAEVTAGQDMFQGKIRFENGGPACNSCHEVRNDAVIGGGVLAKELTTVFGTMGGPGVSAILGAPPFPVMEQAYKDKPLTDGEVMSLIGFLKHADEQAAFQQPRDYGLRLVLSGLVGLAILLGFFGLLWRRRKKRSVNQDIFDRQVRSS